MEIIKPKPTSGDREELFSHPRAVVPDVEEVSDQAQSVSKHTGLLFWVGLFCLPATALAVVSERSNERFKSMRLLLHSLLLSAV